MRAHISIYHIKDMVLRYMMEKSINIFRQRWRTTLLKFNKLEFWPVRRTGIL